ncbi:MAG: GtrA family protein [Clostridia bacterium]|mgnify:FL=1|nr:GtrA family protein [Clostridia bacterium]
MAIELLEKVENFFLNILKKIGLGFLAKIYEDHREGMRYIVFGALATLVNIVFSSLFYYFVFKTLPEKSRSDLSNAVGIGLAMAFAYVTNKLFVFDSKTEGIKALLKEMASFIGCRLITAVVEILMMRVTVVYWELNYVLMKIVTNIVVMILNFIFSKIFIFKKGANKDEEKNS